MGLTVRGLVAIALKQEDNSKDQECSAHFDGNY
jgi:hypothetical protein